MDHKAIVFASVFSVPSISHTTPTPIATPEVGFTAAGQSFGSALGGAFSSSVGGPGNGSEAQRAVRRNLAWSTATRFLSLPNRLVGGNASLDTQKVQRSAEVDDAFEYLLVGDGKVDEADGQEEDLMDWYTNEMRLHFAHFVRPALGELWRQELHLERAWDILEETQQLLAQVQNLYLQPFNHHILPFLHRSTGTTSSPDQSVVFLADGKFRRDIHTVFAHCLPPQRYSQTLSFVLYDAGCKQFSVYTRNDGVQSNIPHEGVKAVRRRMITLLRGLEAVGLAGESAQKAFAHAMDKLLDSFITSHYLKVDWFAKTSIVPQLRIFISDGFTPFVELVMECLRCGHGTVLPAELQQWQDMALGRLGRARVDALFDFVINWKHSLGAILDLKEYLKVSSAKQRLASSFAQQVSRRLLHAGATTTYILNVYISIIRAFHELDPKGVLLERVARPIRAYLKGRDDTARIIISSLLADVNDDGRGKLAPSSELSYEIAEEMQKPFANFGQDMDDELNFADMNWQPPPTDASLEYKKSKAEDVTFFLLTLWEREDFINELKNILGNHLLQCEDPDYEKEIRLLELIKVRLGDDKLQACEVMLRDVLDSRRINTSIRASDAAFRTPDRTHMPYTPDNAVPRTPRSRRSTTSAQKLQTPSTPSSRVQAGPTLNAQILSSFFWPLLRDDHFLVPAQIQALQKEYESRFERIKGMRKLRWMNALGQSTITLDFEDRSEEYTGLLSWQVSVIYAFQPQPGEERAGGSGARGKGKSRRDKDGGIARTIGQLEDMLEMDEQLVRQAIGFWVGKSVLRETATDTYAVVENSSTADVDVDAAAAAQELAEVQAQAQAGAVRSQADLLAEKKDVYCSFVLAMLTNQGNLPLQMILKFMRIMVQGGFPFGAEELEYLLKEMEGDGKVIGLGGDVWAVKK